MDFRGARDLTVASSVEELHQTAAVTRLVTDEQAGEVMSFAAGPFTMYCVISALQLTLTHPGLGPTKSVIDQAARQLIGLFEGDGEIVELLHKGFDRRYDR